MKIIKLIKKMDTSDYKKIGISVLIVLFFVLIVFLFSSRYSSMARLEIESQSLFEAGIKYYNNGDYEKALVEFGKISNEAEIYEETSVWIQKTIDGYTDVVVQKSESFLNEEKYEDAYELVIEAVGKVGDNSRLKEMTNNIENVIIENVEPKVNVNYNIELSEGEDIDYSQISLECIYLDKIKKNGKVHKVTPTKANTYGENVFDVYYSADDFVQMKINVNPKLVEIKAEYIGEKLDAGKSINKYDINVIGIYSDGNSEKIKDYSLQTSVLENIGPNNIGISYGQLSCTLLIDAAAPLERLEINYLGRELYVGDSVGKSDFSVVGVYADGNRKEIADYNIDNNIIYEETSVISITYKGIKNTCTVYGKSTNLIVDKLSSSEVKIAPYDYVEKTINKAEIQFFSGKISSKEQIDSYSFTPQNSGCHRIEFVDINDRFYVSVYQNGNYMGSKKCYAGEGLSLNLVAGKKYDIKINYVDSVGDYKFFIGLKKETIDISQYTSIIDSIEYVDQENTYLYNCSYSGVYRFELSEASERYYVAVYQEGNYIGGAKCYEGGGVTVRLQANMSYKILVEYLEDCGEYKISIGKQKQTTNIAEYSLIKDSIQFIDQVNNYTFVCSRSGIYRFDFSESPGRCYIAVYQEGNYIGGAKCYEGGGVTVNLTEGMNYNIKIEHLDGIGSYTVRVGKQKETQYISRLDSINDSIEYVDQTNKYIFECSDEGEYTFVFSKSNERFYISIYNDGNYIGSKKCYEGNSITVSLKSGKEYIILIEYLDKTGDYTLEIQK